MSAERIISRIVNGQLRDFCNAHPDALEPKWISSISKRIVNDLLSRDVGLRLRAALDESALSGPPEDAVAPGPAASAPGMAKPLCPAFPPGFIWYELV